MKERGRLTPIELERLLSIHQSVVTIITFFAGFVFVTIPLVIFSAELSSLYGSLALYSLLASLLVFINALTLHHSNVLRAYGETLPTAIRIGRKPFEPRVADQLIGIGVFLASISISFMLLLKGPGWTIDAAIWFLLSIANPIINHIIIARAMSHSNSSRIRFSKTIYACISDCIYVHARSNVFKTLS